MESITILRPPGSNLSSCAYCISAAGRCAQSISKTRPSRCVILSASFGSLSGERSKARAQDDTAASASFDSQNVFFEMSWPLWLYLSPRQGFRCWGRVVRPRNKPIRVSRWDRESAAHNRSPLLPLGLIAKGVKEKFDEECTTRSGRYRQISAVGE